MNPAITSVIGFIAAAVVTAIVLPFVQRFLITQQIVRKNYKEELIATAMGLVYIFIVTMTFAVYTVLFPYIFPNQWNNGLQSNVTLLLFSALFIGIIGWLDDTQGDKVVKGFSGHFGKLLKQREMTTGALKAMSGGFIALLAALAIPGTLMEKLLNFFIVALMTNWINLLDLRPGRSVKFFLFAMIVLSLLTQHKESYFLLAAPLCGMVIALFPGDLKAKFMIGDTGANVIGVIAGILIALFAPFYLKVITFVFLLAGQTIAEVYSVSKLIRQIPLLRWIDEWGRAKEKDQQDVQS